jgi:hypothetical protein
MGVKMSSSTPFSRQTVLWGRPEGTTMESPGFRMTASPSRVAEFAGQHVAALGGGVGMLGPRPAFFKGYLHGHEAFIVGQDAPGDAAAQVDGLLFVVNGNFPFHA